MSAGVNLGTSLEVASAEFSHVVRAASLTLSGTALYLTSKISAEIRSEAKAHLTKKGLGTFRQSLSLVALDLDYIHQSTSVFWGTFGGVLMLVLSIICSIHK